MLEAGSVFTILGGKFDSAGFDRYNAANARAVASATATERVTDRLGATQQRLSTAMRSGASDAARFGEALPLRLMDQYDKNVSKARTNLNTLGRDARNVGAVGLLAVGAAAVYAAAKATTFNRELLKLHTQAGATTDEVARFRGEILQLAGTVPQGPKELSEGLYHIVSAGFRGAQALDILKASAKGAALSGADLQDTANALIGTLASQVAGVHGAADAQGQLNAIVGAGNLRFEDLDKAVATGVLPTFAAAGLQLKDFGAALATVTDNSTPANVTATRLRMTIAQMVDPTKAAAKELESIGLTSTSLADDLRKPNGLLVAVEDLRTHLRDSGKTAVEQDQILSAAFGRGKSSATIITLVGEIDRLRNKYRELGQTNGVERLTKDWADFQKSEAGAFSELKSGAEAFAITAGTVLLPSLAKLAREGGQALRQFMSSGDAERFGHDLEGIFSTAAHAASDLLGPLEAVGGILYHVAAAGVSVGEAFGLSLPAQIASVGAAFLTFRAVTFIAPILLAVAGGISQIGVAAATAPSIGAFFSDLSEGGLLLPALAAALALAGGAFVAIESGLFSSASAAEKNAAAMRKDKEAVTELHNALTKTSDAHVQAERTALQHKEALERLRKVEKEVIDGQLKGSAAANAQKEATLNVVQAQNDHATAVRELAKERAQLTTVSQKGVKTAQETTSLAKEELETFEQVIALHPAANSEERALQQKHLTELQHEYNAALTKSNQLEAEAQVHQESLNRLNAGVANAVITQANAQGVAQLQKSLQAAGASQKVTSRYELESQGAQSQLGELSGELERLGHKTVVEKILTTAPSAQVAIEALKAVTDGLPSSKVLKVTADGHGAIEQLLAIRALVAGVPESKIVHIETTAASEKQAVEELRVLIASLQDKTVNIRTITTSVVQSGSNPSSGKLHASGRGPTGAEQAIVGEGSAPEWVVNRRTGRATRVDRPTLLGLTGDDYVIPTESRYRGGALELLGMLAGDLGVKGFKKGRKAPGKLDPLSIPLSDLESKASSAKTAYDEAKTKAHEVHATSTDHAREQRAGEKLHQLQGELRKAKAFAASVKQQEDLANIAANQMRLAPNQTAYVQARDRRMTALAALRGLLDRQQGHVSGGNASAFYRQLTLQLQGAALEEQATESEGGLTPSQHAEEKKIEEAIALASLTPGTADDVEAQGRLVNFLRGALSSAQGAGAPPEAIIELANSLHQAQQTLESVQGTGSESADAQAQVTQANERAAAAERTADIANQALAVFGGTGDIGAGGRNAAAAVTQNVYTLHPGDPATLRAIGDAAVAGIGHQGLRRATRVRTGVA